MAVIRKFDERIQEFERSQPEGKAAICRLLIDDEKFVQINNYRVTSDNYDGKRSSNIRLSKEAFDQLVEIGRKHFYEAN